MLYFWPALPARLMRPQPGESLVYDHASLDLCSGESHLTGYDANDTRSRPRQGRSRVLPLRQTGYRVWLVYAAKWSALPPQDDFREVAVALTSDTPRRINEWCRFCSAAEFQTVALPPAPSPTDFLVIELGLANSPDDMRGAVSPCWDMPSIVDGFVAPAEVVVSAPRIGGVCLGIRAWLPGGTMKDDVVLGLPRRKDQR
jgi:hypothetical protein